MEMSIYRGERAFALGVVGAATLLATMAGEYLMHNPTQAQVWHACLLDNCPTFDVFGYVPLPATTIVLPGGATLGITLYQILVLALGALILGSALACALRTTRARQMVLAAAAVLLALTLMVFHAQAPTQLVVGNPAFVPHPYVIPYVPRDYIGRPNGIPQPPPMIDPFWFMAPAAALGLLTAGLAILPAARRTAET
jgi:hypothetical protein